MLKFFNSRTEENKVQLGWITTETIIQRLLEGLICLGVETISYFGWLLPVFVRFKQFIRKKDGQY